MGYPTVAFQDPLLRSIHSPSGLHEDLRDSLSLGTRTGHPPDSVPGRLVVAFRLKVSTEGTKLLQFCNLLGITINLEKFELIPFTRMTYLRMVLDSRLAKAFPSAERLDNLNQILWPFLSGQPRRAKDWQRLIGHLVSLEKLVPQGRLKLRGVQWNQKEAWNQRDSPHKVVPVTTETKEVLGWWIDTSNTLKGMPFVADPPEMLFFTDASKEGWGAHLLDSTARGRWGPEEKNLHINVLEMMAVQRACLEFIQKLRGNTVALMCDNATVVAYIKKQGGLKSKELCSLTLEFLEWAEREQIKISARFIPGKRNVLADGLSRVGQVVGSKWSLHPEVAKALIQKWDSPVIDLFATILNAQLPVFCSPVPDPGAAFEDAFQHP
ncbi:uncharacterized protein [Palaemon carinicauda]|uniref:uncharacterized protein n=1 Tax=Palaemon carinicauda TaxID=392227 RepID=UPI0035B5B071